MLKKILNFCELNDITPLRIAEFGSKSVGLDSVDSDSDLLTIYTPNKNFYLKLNKPNLHHQFKYLNDMGKTDVKIISIQEILKMIYKGNYSYMQSIYYNTPMYRGIDFSELKKLYIDTFDKKKFMLHYANWGLSAKKFKQKVTCYLMLQRKNNNKFKLDELIITNTHLLIYKELYNYMVGMPYKKEFILEEIDKYFKFIIKKSEKYNYKKIDIKKFDELAIKYGKLGKGL